MKNIHEILSGLGIGLPEDKKPELDKQLSENYKTVAEFDRLKAKSDGFETQLGETKTALKAFDGVDVAELKGQITKLSSDLEAKEAEYTAKLADMEFDTALDAVITASGARNAKAVKALLDRDALKASKNRDGDIKSALDALKSENDYLFGSTEPVNNPVAPTNTAGDQLSAIRAAMNLR